MILPDYRPSNPDLGGFENLRGLEPGSILTTSQGDRLTIAPPTQTSEALKTSEV